MAGGRAVPRLTTTGNPAHVELEAAVRRALDQTHAQLGALAASDIAYTPASLTAWSGTAPSTVGEALDRIAAALGPIP